MNNDKKREMKDVFPVFLMGGLFVLIHSLALLVTGPFEAADVGVFSNPNDPMNVVFFFVTLLLFTVAVLLIAKFWKKQLIRGIILGATGYLAFYVFSRGMVIISLHSSRSYSSDNASQVS